MSDIKSDYQDWQRHVNGDWVGFEFLHRFHQPGRGGQPDDIEAVQFRVTGIWKSGYWRVERIDGKPYSHSFNQCYLLQMLAERMMTRLFQEGESEQ